MLLAHAGDGCLSSFATVPFRGHRCVYNVRCVALRCLVGTRRGWAAIRWQADDPALDHFDVELISREIHVGWARALTQVCLWRAMDWRNNAARAGTGSAHRVSAHRFSAPNRESCSQLQT